MRYIIFLSFCMAIVSFSAHSCCAGERDYDNTAAFSEVANIAFPVVIGACAGVATQQITSAFCGGTPHGIGCWSMMFLSFALTNYAGRKFGEAFFGVPTKSNIVYSLSQFATLLCLYNI